MEGLSRGAVQTTHQNGHVHFGQDLTQFTLSEGVKGKGDVTTAKRLTSKPKMSVIGGAVWLRLSLGRPTSMEGGAFKMER